MENIIINLFGSPGTGKSTLAAELFAKMKWLKMDVELVTEYAKDLVWEERDKTLENQIYVFGKQHNRIYRLLDKVKYIITDSPLLLSSFYNNMSFKSKELNDLIISEHNKTRSLNIFLKRTKEYNPKGRNQTEEESNQYSIDIQNHLNNIIGKINYTILNADENTTNVILKHLETKEKIKSLCGDFGGDFAYPDLYNFKNIIKYIDCYNNEIKDINNQPFYNTIYNIEKLIVEYNSFLQAENNSFLQVENIFNNIENIFNKLNEFEEYLKKEFLITPQKRLTEYLINYDY